MRAREAKTKHCNNRHTPPPSRKPPLVTNSRSKIIVNGTVDIPVDIPMYSEYRRLRDPNDPAISDYKTLAPSPQTIEA